MLTDFTFGFAYGRTLPVFRLDDTFRVLSDASYDRRAPSTDFVFLPALSSSLPVAEPDTPHCFLPILLSVVSRHGQ